MIKLKSLLTESLNSELEKFLIDLIKKQHAESQAEFAIQFLQKFNSRFDGNEFRKAVGVKPKFEKGSREDLIQKAKVVDRYGSWEYPEIRKQLGLKL